MRFGPLLMGTPFDHTWPNLGSKVGCGQWLWAVAVGEPMIEHVGLPSLASLLVVSMVC